MADLLARRVMRALERAGFILVRLEWQFILR